MDASWTRMFWFHSRSALRAHFQHCQEAPPLHCPRPRIVHGLALPEDRAQTQCQSTRCAKPRARVVTSGQQSRVHRIVRCTERQRVQQGGQQRAGSNVGLPCERRNSEHGQQRGRA
eukprot:360121-Chlamydomonas_euryale.AAC.20